MTDAEGPPLVSNPHNDHDFARATGMSIEQSSPAKEKEIEVSPHRDDDDISIAHSHESASTQDDHGDHDPEADPKPTISRTTSVTPEAVVVERRDRRGLFATLTIIPEVKNPYHYARSTKWFITLIVAICAMAGPMGSAIVMPTLSDITKQFNSTATIGNMSVAVYMLSMSIFPLWWSSFSETLGRRTIYLVSFVMFTVFAILSAVATNIAMLIVMRMISGGAAASVQAVGAGTIADIWEVKERGRAMGFFYLGPLCGPLLAPIIGGVLAQELGWRSTQWFLVIYGGITVIMIIFCLPETLRPKDPKPNVPDASTAPPLTSDEKSASPDLARVSTVHSVHIKTKSYLKALKRFFIDPILVLRYLRYPPVAITVYYASITFGCLYFLNISIQATFARSPYNFETLIVGLLYIPNSLGYFITSLVGGRWIDSIMHREAKKAGRYDDRGKLIFRPEDRMRENAWIAAVMWPGALIWYGWTAEKGIFWIVPMIANFFFGVGSMLIFSLATTMLTEFMPKRASSGVAINNFVRNICSFTAAVVAEDLINAIGNGWMTTILGLWSLLSGFAVLWAMRVKGAEWRVRMVEALEKS